MTPQEMRQKIAELKAESERADTERYRLESQLSECERHCPHQFGAAVYDPIITRGYTSPGDPPGTMGVDWRGPTSISGSKKDRWKRTCATCGKIEYTTQQRAARMEPDFGDSHYKPSSW